MHYNIAMHYSPQQTAVGFAKLMRLYERNYALLIKMLPQNMAQLPDYWVSHLPRHKNSPLDVHLWVLERAKYTTTLRLSYCFLGNDDFKRLSYEPDFKVRIYHDARNAEAMSAIVKGKLRAHPQLDNRHWRFQLNWFLYRWLRYLDYLGHSFKPAVTSCGLKSQLKQIMQQQAMRFS